MHSNESTHRSFRDPGAARRRDTRSAARGRETRSAAAPAVRLTLLALLGALACALAAPAFAHAEATEPSNPNNYECSGSLGAGKAEAGGEETPVAYTFECDGQITGYQVQTQLPITGIEGAPVVTNHAGTPLNDTFACSGAFPGYAVNCVGASTTEPEEKISGQFEIGWKLCTEPRVDALLTVTYAYLEKGVITQAISGPFELGRPLGCPATARSGKDRLNAFQGAEPKKGRQGKSAKDKLKHDKGAKGKSKGKTPSKTLNKTPKRGSGKKG